VDAAFFRKGNRCHSGGRSEISLTSGGEDDGRLMEFIKCCWRQQDELENLSFPSLV